MVQTIEQGDIFGRIGKSFGQGLGEAIPKAQERKYLSEGLKKVNPQLGETYAIPGMIEHPEIANQAMKFAQSTRAKDVIKKRDTLSPKSQSVGMQGTESPISTKKTENELPPKFDRTADNYLMKTSSDILDTEAANLSDESGMPYEEVRDIIGKRDISRVESEKEFEGRNKLGEDELVKSVEEFTQKPGNEVYKDLTGKMLQQYKTLVANDIVNGKSPIQSARTRGNELLRMAETRQQISTEAAKSAFGESRSEAQRIVKGLRDEYKKTDSLGLYQEDLIGKLKMQPSFASTIAFPVSNHKEFVPIIKNYRKDPIKYADTILKDLNNSDSLQSIALAIEENAGRGSGQRFLERVSAEKSAGKLDKLTERQIKELGYEFNPKPTIRDLYYTSLFGNRSGV